jgi:ADP-ribose pyrophosphatase
MTETRTLFNGRYLRLSQRGSWEFVERTNAGGAVIVVAVTPGDCVLFVEQHRIPLGGRTIEMPAGLVGDLDENDSFELAAARELLEETGWRASRVELLMSGPSSAGMSSEIIAFARASGLVREHAGGGDESENITVHEIPRAQAAAWIDARRRDGYAIDPKLYAGLWFIDRNPDGSPA